MKVRTILAVLASAALPVAAQAASPNADPRPAQKVESKAKTDGPVTKKERAKVAKAQDKQGKSIRKQKHDKQKQATAT